MFPDGRREIFGCELHGGDVEGVPVDQPGRVGLHDVDGAFDGVGHVHHVQLGVRLQEAGVASLPDGFIEDLDGIVGGAPTGFRYPGDQAGIANTPGVHAEPQMEIVGQEFTCHLGHTIDGGGSLDGDLRRRIGRGRGAEGGDGAGNEDSTSPGPCDLQGVFQPTQVHLVCPMGVGFSRGGQNRSEVVDGVRLESKDGLVHDTVIGTVHNLEWAAGSDGAFRLPDVGGQYVLAPISFS